jgi:hypothetical protein
MYDSVETIQDAPGGQAPSGVGWLLFIHQIPPKPDYFRVKVRRRLQRIGALALKNSVYVLPHTDDATEDFQWLRGMVVDEGGEATICAASFIEGLSDGELTTMFRDQSNAEYDEIIRAAEAARQEPTDTGMRGLERRLAQATARDFFAADRRGEAERAVRDAQTPRTAPAEALAGGPDASAPQAATWVTRTGVQVDRMASAWLIQRFIDPHARFKFVPARGYQPQRGELRFDMFEGEFTHEGDACTFEVLAGRFVPEDMALRAIGEIVHDVDCKDEKFGREEVAGVASVIGGIAATHEDDPARLAASATLFDSLYATFRRQVP